MRRNSLVIGMVAVAFALLWFALLSERPLFDPDEGRYAEIPREMLSGGDWVIPHLNGLAYLEKPPLQYWLTAAVFRSIGPGEFAARLCTGIAGFLSLATVFFLGARLWGRNAGLNALLYTVGSTLFVLLGHQLTLDMLLSFWLLAALCCFILAQAARDAPARNRAWMLGCWAAMALAVLTKGLIGVLIPAATVTIYMVWQRDWQVLRRMNFAWGLALFTTIAAPWFILAARANPSFLTFFFIREHFQRFLTPIEHRTEPWWFFIAVLIVGILPWMPRAAAALVSTVRERVPRGAFDAPRLLWVWCVFVVVFFSLSDSKLIPYILPAVPALALLCANPTVGEGRRSLMVGGFLSLASCAAIVAYASGRWASAQTETLLLLVRPALWATSVLVAVGAVVAIGCAARAKAGAGLAALCMAWFAASVAILVGASRAQELFSAKDIAAELRAVGPAETPVFTIQSYEQSLPFYLGRTVVLVNYRDEFDLGLTQQPQRGIPSLQQFAGLWAALPEGYAVVSPQSRNRLEEMHLPMREIAHFPERVIISRR